LLHNNFEWKVLKGKNYRQDQEIFSLGEIEITISI